MHIDKSFVLTWAALYEQRMGSTEPWLLDNVVPAAAARGHYEPDEFTAVARWKTPRSRPAIAANSSSDIRQITAMAFAAPESLQHRALTLLHGVGVPTAIDFAGGHASLEETTAVISFDDPEGVHHQNNWPRADRKMVSH
jgi:hypothetical protein